MTNADTNTTGCSKHGPVDICGHTDATCPDSIDRLLTEPTTQLKVVEETEDILGTGLTEGIVHRVSVELIDSDGKSYAAVMAEKIFNDPTADEPTKQKSIDSIISTHQRLKQSGLSTIPTMVPINERGSILMTDLTEQEKLAEHNYHEAIKFFVQGMRSHIQSDEKFSLEPVLKKLREFRAKCNASREG